MGELVAMLTELKEYMCSEQDLAEFVPDVTRILEQAKAVSRGEYRVESIERDPGRRIPSRKMAAAIVRVMRGYNPAPQSLRGEAHERVLAEGNLLGNLVRAVTTCTFREYPELVRQDPEGAGT